MQLRSSILIRAPRARVFASYADYTGWPRLFARTIRGVRLLREQQGQTQTIEVKHVEGRVINRVVVTSLAGRL